MLLVSLPWPGTTTTGRTYHVTLPTLPPLLRFWAELRCSSVGPRKWAPSCSRRFTLSSPYGACHKSLHNPQIYNSWGNFFEQFSLVTGAVIVYARLSSLWARETLNRVGRILIGLCAASFALEQAFYLGPTASLVPKWIPPSQMFWAIATTVLFALAAVALFANRMALLATRLLTMMLVIFGLLVWVPLLLSDAHNHTNWGETIETFAIAGAAWILADLLGEYRHNDDRSR